MHRRCDVSTSQINLTLLGNNPLDAMICMWHEERLPTQPYQHDRIWLRGTDYHFILHFPIQAEFEALTELIILDAGRIGEVHDFH